MKTNTKQILTILNIISWVIFIGICIKAGALLYSSFVSLVINPDAAGNLYRGLDLSNLFHYNIWNYVAVLSLLIFIICLKAYIFYLLIRIFAKINFVHPFSVVISKLIGKISHVAIQIGIITIIANSYCKWLIKQGVDFPGLQDYLGASAEFLLLGGIVFMIAQVFKRGIEIQSENELTV